MTEGKAPHFVKFAKDRVWAYTSNSDTGGAQISGSGITLTAALTLAHASGAQVVSDAPTPEAPNKYSRKRN